MISLKKTSSEYDEPNTLWKDARGYPYKGNL